MLNLSEDRVMRALCSECSKKSAILITPSQLVKTVNSNTVNEKNVEKIVCDLDSDGYLDLVYSSRRDERVYCISLTPKGKGYLRKIKLAKRNLAFRVGLTAALALFSFLIGLILKAIF